MLSASELDTLVNRVIPKARGQLCVHGQAKHAATTLAYWGEPIEVPDSVVDSNDRRTTRQEILDALGWGQ
jgi:hypothetical protein